MNKLVAIMLGGVLFACTPAELQKVNDTVDKVQAQVTCKAAVLQPYAAYFTKEQLEEAIQKAKAPKEALEAVEVAVDEVKKVVEAFEACSK